MKPSRTPFFTCITLPTHITFSTDITSHRIPTNAFGPLSLLALLYQLTSHSQLTSLPTGYTEARMGLHEAIENPLLYLHHFTNSHYILNWHYVPPHTQKRVWTPFFTSITLPTHNTFSTDITSHRIPRNAFGPSWSLRGPLALPASLYQLTSHSQLTLLPTGYP